MIVYCNRDNFEKEVFGEGEGTVLIDFFADWCAPCKRQEPIIQSLAKEDGLKIVKVSVEECPDIADAFKLHAIPSIYVLKNGKVLRHGSGFQSREQILDMIQAQPEPVTS